MKNQRGVSIVATALAVLWFAGADRADACVCRGPKNAKEEAKVFRENRAKAVVIFVGRVVSLEVIKDAPPGWPRHTAATFSILRGWKGISSPFVVIDSASNCAMAFEVGQEVLVFGYGSPPEASVCVSGYSRRRPEDIKQIEQRLGTPSWRPKS